MHVRRSCLPKFTCSNASRITTASCCTIQRTAQRPRSMRRSLDRGRCAVRWVVQQDGATASIDAPEAGPVEEALRTKKWRITDILVTHHHADHTGGIAELKARHGCRVTAPQREAPRIPAVDATVCEGDSVTIAALVGRVLETPGHTAGHISYWFQSEIWPAVW